MKRAIIAIVTLVLVLAAAAATYSYLTQQRTINQLETSKNELASQVQSLKATIASSEAKKPTTPLDKTTFTSEKGVQVTVTSPVAGAVINSPLTISGNVPGSWSFEAQFTVRILDAQGNILGQAPATLSGDWMTEAMVPFTVTINFTQSASKNGTLVLLKANPSGLAANNDTVTVPIEFQL